MLEPPYFARRLLAGGIVLAVAGLILWWLLPIPASFPPYGFTALLAMGCGGFEIWRNRAPR